MSESEFDGSTKFECWVEPERSNPEVLLGGLVHEHIKLLAFLNFSLSNRVSLQPGVEYITERSKRTPALHWCLDCVDLRNWLTTCCLFFHYKVVDHFAREPHQNHPIATGLQVHIFLGMMIWLSSRATRIGLKTPDDAIKESDREE